MLAANMRRITWKNAGISEFQLDFHVQGASSSACAFKNLTSMVSEHYPGSSAGSSETMCAKACQHKMLYTHTHTHTTEKNVHTKGVKKLCTKGAGVLGPRSGKGFHRYLGHAHLCCCGSSCLFFFLLSLPALFWATNEMVHLAVGMGKRPIFWKGCLCQEACCQRKEYLRGVWFRGGHACCAGKLTLGLHVVLQFSLLVQFHGLQRSFQQLDGNGDAELDSYLAMPGNTSTGDLWYRNRSARRPRCQGACTLGSTLMTSLTPRTPCAPQEPP